MRKAKVKTEIAILIQKHANNKKSDQQAIRSMLRMRYAVQSKKPVENRYYLEFMTKKGRKKFLVDARYYNSIKIDSLGELSHEKGRFISFEYHKKATTKDIDELGW